MATMEELETTKTEPEKKPVRRARGYFDYSLLFVWIFIMLLGYVLLYSASSYVALTSYGNSFFFLKKTGIFHSRRFTSNGILYNNRLQTLEELCKIRIYGTH